MPKVVGSAWTPWDLPMQGVSRYLSALSFNTSMSASMPLMMISPDCFSCMERAVSTMSLEVSP